jgi:BirA family biotin operon repressor/biotin-[acetyl-CoA-carboxylase] ligase
LPTCLEPFKKIHLAACASTNDYLKQNIARLEADFPVMVSADVQSAGRGREKRGWSSPENLGIYATFGFILPDNRALPLLSITCGVAVADMLQGWTGKTFALKWPNDILAGGNKIAGILCETMINGDKVICLAGIGINVNQHLDDFPPELRERAGSLRLLTAAEWPLADGRERLAAAMASWLENLFAGCRSRIIDRARELSRPFLGRTVSFHHQGRMAQGIFLDIVPDGGLLLQLAGGEKKIFYSGELD